MVRTVEELRQDEKLTVEILELFPRQGEWTEDDYFRLLPETNRRIELSEGRIIITPAPTDQHQKIIGKLHFLVYSYILNKNIGDVRLSLLDVKLWKDKIRQPDIVFMSNEHRDRITEKYWGVPDLAIEVLSESTAQEDRKEKFYEYASAGVSEYWIVDPVEQSIEVFVLEKGAYVLFGKWGVSEIAKSKLLASFEVNVSYIMT